MKKKTIKILSKSEAKKVKGGGWETGKHEHWKCGTLRGGQITDCPPPEPTEG